MTAYNSMTSGQCRLVSYLWHFFNENHQIPPRHAIASHFGWSSENAAHEKLNLLAWHSILKKNQVGKWMFTEDAFKYLTAHGFYTSLYKEKA